MATVKRKEKRYEYNENPTLLWLLAVSVISASLGVVGFVVEEYSIRIALFALSIILLCIVFAVFVVAIVAPFVSEALVNSHYGKKLSPEEREEEALEYNVIVKDVSSLDD